MQVSLLLGAAFVISSCDDVIGQEDNPVASYVQWDAKTPKSIELTLGIAAKSTATVKAVAVSSVVIVYESENPEIAKVDPVTGVITAVGVGETNIKAVVTGASSAGQSVFIPEEIKIPVVVKDGKASLKTVKGKEVIIEYTANFDSTIVLKDLFTAYPEIGTANDKSSISYKMFTYDYNTGTKKYEYNSYAGNTNELGNIATISGEEKFQVGKALKNTDTDKSGISDTIYIVAELKPFNSGTPTYVYPTGTDKSAVQDTVKVIINKSIAFINKAGKREILTADKYKELKTADFSKAIEGGKYYVTSAGGGLGDIAIKGDVDLIFASGVNLGATSISDQTDAATLSIFGEAIDVTPKTPKKYQAASPTIIVSATAGDAISNFAEINFYTGTITATTSKANSGAIVKIKNLNVFGGTLTASNTASGYAISLLEGGKLTVKGGIVTATGKGSDTDRSYGVIGDVEVAKGTFQATSDYRAVKGSLTAGEGLEIVESNDGTTWTKITGTTSNAKGVKSQAKK
jgi:hypothetical protein